MIVNYTTGVNQQALRVHDGDRERWQAALDRFSARLRHRDEPLLQFRPIVLHDAICRSYDVVSYSQPGTRHLVELFLVEAELYERCDCTAGELRIPCQHAAGAIEDAGWWPFELARQLELVELPVSQAPPALYRLGQLVRQASARRTALSVTGLRYDPALGWLYQLKTLAGMAWPFEVLERSLLPHTNRKRRAA